MGTAASVSVPACRSDELADVRAEVAEVLRLVERELSVFRPDSDLGRLNAAAGLEAVPVKARTAAVLAYALRVAEESGGAFDPTVGPWMTLWGFRSEVPPGRVPSAEAMARTRADTGWTNVVLRPAATAGGAGEAGLRIPGVRVDLGGIAKGYAVDLGYDRLLAAGRRDFLVNLAGNMRARGRAASDRDGWRVGVRDPFGEREHLGVLVLSDGEAVATSGNYERFVMIEGRRYAHIIDPRSGFPVAGMAGVTVLARSAMEADALSTALYVLGPDEGAALLARHSGCEALFIPDERPRRMLLTPGLAHRFRAEPGADVRVSVLDPRPAELITPRVDRPSAL